MAKGGNTRQLSIHFLATARSSTGLLNAGRMGAWHVAKARMAMLSRPQRRFSGEGRAQQTEIRPAVSNSKRPELYAYTGILEVFLSMLHTFSMWSNKNTNLGGQFRSVQITPTDDTRQTISTSISNEADLLLIWWGAWLVTEMPQVQQEVKWVKKAHQDDEQPFEDLPFNAQLNVSADLLATDYYKN